MIRKIFSNELVRSSLILMILLNIGNGFSYLFQFVMARLLGPADYGILAVITGVVAIFSIPSLSIQTVVAKNTAQFNAYNKISKIKGMFVSLIKKLSIYSFIVFILFSIISIPLSGYLKIDFPILLLSGLFIFGAFLQPVGAGILQGLKKFNSFGIIFLINTIFKFTMGVFLVLLGWKVYGATLGFIIGITLSFIFTFPFIMRIMRVKSSEEEIQIFTKKGFVEFMGVFIFVFLFSLDVFFVKAFFSAESAGKYAVISMIGKIILFLAMTIGNVMLPINSEKFIKGHKTKDVFRKTIMLTLLICGIPLMIFYLFPEFVVKILFGEIYSSASNILLYVGVAFSFLSLLNILLLEKISTEKFRIKELSLMFLFLIVQIIVFLIYHNSIEQFSIAFMFSTIITFIGMLIFSEK
jgi:O-antigen/teichoic acid export membrane protein